jgi:RNA polymerase sigma-70 factor (ECF subfamily)
MSTLTAATVDSPRKNPPSLSDADLMARARRGDRSAYAQLVLRHQDRIFNILVRLLGDTDEASELAQETFARALSRIEEFPARAQPYIWLMRIAVNLGVSADRQDKRRRKSIIENDPAHRLALEALVRLEIDYRVVLVLRDMEGLDYEQMSDVLTVPPATVKSRLFRARLALRDELRA